MKDKSHFRVVDTVFYGENYINLEPRTLALCSNKENTMKPENEIEIVANGKVHRFAFDPETDDPADGATLIGVRWVGSTDIHELAPSQHAEPAAWDAANKHYGI